MKLKSDTALSIFIFAIIGITIWFIYSSGYKNGYDSAEARMETYEDHIENCEGNCDHIEKEIEERVYWDEELIYRDDIFGEEDVYSSDDMDVSYWEGAYDGYIQGYGDRHYGNKRELDISEYEDEDMF